MPSVNGKDSLFSVQSNYSSIIVGKVVILLKEFFKIPVFISQGRYLRCINLNFVSGNHLQSFLGLQTCSLPTKNLFFQNISADYYTTLLKHLLRKIESMYSRPTRHFKNSLALMGLRVYSQSYVTLHLDHLNILIVEFCKVFQ